MAVPVVNPGSSSLRVSGFGFEDYQMTAASDKPVTWSMQAFFPYSAPLENFSIDPATGVISGRQGAGYLEPGTYVSRIRATNADGSGIADFTLEVLPSLAPEVGGFDGIYPTIGAPYSWTISPVYSDSPVTWSFSESSESLPAGLSIDLSTGTISGVAEQEEYPMVTLIATNDYGWSYVFLQFVVLNESSPPAFQSTNHSDEVAIGSSYSYSFAAYGPGPFTWSAVDLPSWASIDVETGVISGVASGSEGDFSYSTIYVDNANGQAEAYLEINLTGSEPEQSPLIEDFPAHFELKEGEFYSYQFTTFAGTQPITWRVVDGFDAGLTLPEGLSMSETGLMSGIPAPGSSTAGKFDDDPSLYIMTVEAENYLGSDARSWAANVLPPDAVLPIVTTESLPDMMVTVPCEYQLEASGTRPITWSANNIPAGLTLSASGLLYGTPEEVVSGLLYVIATNSAGSAGGVVRIKILPEPATPVILTEELPDARKGVPYSFQLDYEADAPYLFTLRGPSGVGISQTGLIMIDDPDWTPPDPGEPEVIDIRIDTMYRWVEKSFSINLLPPLVVPSIITTVFAEAELNRPYSAQLQADGTEPISWTADGLPVGLSLDGETGSIYGTATASGSYTVTVTATNEAGSDSRDIALVVYSPQVDDDGSSWWQAFGEVLGLN